jgi:hypothetical protein
VAYCSPRCRQVTPLLVLMRHSLSPQHSVQCSVCLKSDNPLALKDALPLAKRIQQELSEATATRAAPLPQVPPPSLDLQPSAEENQPSTHPARTIMLMGRLSRRDRPRGEASWHTVLSLG